MAWRSQVDPSKHKKSQIALTVLLFLVLVVVCFAVWKFVINDDPEEQLPVTQTEQSEPEPEPVVIEPEPEFDEIVLQSTLDQWSAGLSGNDSVVISDVNSNVLASTNPGESYFAASIYKLYVAYFGYQQVDDGLVNPDEVYVNGKTRAECLDLMIRESDSPCAETLLVELGKQELNEQLADLGILNTDMVNITTTAADAAIMLGLIARGEGLSPASQAALLESMRTQVYRDALNAGFSDGVTVYNKIGFRELVEYHDTAIIELSDGRQLVVSVLSENVGTRNIAELARQLELVL